MMVKRLEWPYVAARARDVAAESLQAAVAQLEPMAMDERAMTETEKIKRILLAMSYCQKALRSLESVGAPTRAF